MKEYVTKGGFTYCPMCEYVEGAGHSDTCRSSKEKIIIHRLNESLIFMIHKETGSLVVTNDGGTVLGAASTQEFANLFQVMMEWAESSK